jgi:hypothetical protein
VRSYDHETIAIDNHRSTRTWIDNRIDRSHTPPASIAIDRSPRGGTRDSCHSSIDMTVESARASIERAKPSMARDARAGVTRTRRRAIVRSRAFVSRRTRGGDFDGGRSSARAESIAPHRDGTARARGTGEFARRRRGRFGAARDARA